VKEPKKFIKKYRPLINFGLMVFSTLLAAYQLPTIPDAITKYFEGSKKDTFLDNLRKYQKGLDLEIENSGSVVLDYSGLQTLNQFLVDESGERTGGLKRVVKGDGSVIWVCKEHQKDIDGKSKPQSVTVHEQS